MHQVERTVDDGDQDEAPGVEAPEPAPAGWASPVVQTLPLTSGPSTWAPAAETASAIRSRHAS